MKTICRKLAFAGMTLTLVALGGCQVPPPPPQGNTQAVEDAQTTAEVKAAIMNDAIYRVNQIRVDTFNGVVQLSGMVSTRTEAIHVEEMTKTIKGVKEIRDNLEIR